MAARPTRRADDLLWQLALVDRPGHLVYLFTTLDGDDPDNIGSGSAAIVQPGGTSSREVARLAVGPQVWVQVSQPNRVSPVSKTQPHEQFVTLRPGMDPPHWTWAPPPEDPLRPPALTTPHEDHNKIGGTPNFVQGEEYPPGAGWKFAFQFDTGWAGWGLGDGAEAYGFLRDDLSATWLIQGH
jgi:hypothetical protein